MPEIKLPPLDDEETENKVVVKKNGGSCPSFSLPPLDDDLPELPKIIDIDEDNEVVSDKLPSSFSKFDAFEHIKKTKAQIEEIESSIGEETEDSIEDDSNFKKVEEIEGEDKEDFEKVDEENHVDEEDKDEEDFDPSQFSLIPQANLEDDEDEVKDYQVDEDEPTESVAKGFKELDDKVVKDFLNKIKSRLFKDKKSKKNTKIKKGGLKSLLSVKTVVIIVIVVVIFTTTVFGVRQYNSMYSPLDEVVSVIEDKDNELNVEFTNFVYVDGIITFDVTNNSDISADFFVNTVIKEKGAMPFLGEKYFGVSDIISVGAGDTVTTNLPLEGFGGEQEYKFTYTPVSLQ